MKKVIMDFDMGMEKLEDRTLLNPTGRTQFIKGKEYEIADSDYLVLAPYCTLNEVNVEKALKDGEDKVKEPVIEPKEPEPIEPVKKATESPKNKMTSAKKSK